MGVGEAAGPRIGPTRRNRIAVGGGAVDVWALALGLSMDAIAAACGLAVASRSGWTVAGAAALFGVFQAGMSGLGWAGGAAVGSWVEPFDHWIAFVVLVGLGARTCRGGDEGLPTASGWGAVVGLAFATSIDALAAGVTLPMLAAPAAFVLGVIGGVTLVGAGAGGAAALALGRAGGVGPARLVTITRLGGVVLMSIGVKILVTHLMTGR